jgi:hypothetical protein
MLTRYYIYTTVLADKSKITGALPPTSDSSDVVRSVMLAHGLTFTRIKEVCKSRYEAERRGRFNSLSLPVQESITKIVGKPEYLIVHTKAS